MKAIITKYLGPTDRKPSRIKASDMDGNTVIVAKNGALDTEEAHFQAVKALCHKMKWTGQFRAGGLPDGFAWVWLGATYYEIT